MLAEQDIRVHLNQLAKPPGSLGRLEQLIIQLARVQQTLRPRSTPRRMVLFAADHGVVTEGVSQWPSEITALMVNTIVAGGAASSVLAKTSNTQLKIIDVGVIGSGLPNNKLHVCRKIRQGSRNLAKEPALSIDEFRQSLALGEEQAQEAAAAGMKIVSAGEMGIGNTTPASCLTALLTNTPTDSVTGMGAGGNEAQLEQKREVVFEAVIKAKPLLANDPERAIAAICGLEIAAMAGFYRAAAAANLTIILDGFIATAAALIAEHLWPGVRNQMIAAHRSAEPGHRVALAKLGLEPVLIDWQMRLGEGSGALLIMPLLDAASAICSEMFNLSDIGVQKAS